MQFRAAQVVQVSRMCPPSGPSRNDRDCPLDTARARCLWHAGGTAGENDGAPAPGGDGSQLDRMVRTVLGDSRLVGKSPEGSRQPGVETGAPAASTQELRLRLGVPQNPVVVIHRGREELDRQQLSSRWAREVDGETACGSVKVAAPERSEVPPSRARVGRLEAKDQLVVADGSRDGGFAVGGTVIEKESIDGQPFDGVGPGHRES